MRVKILGGHGGVTVSSAATSFLIDDQLLIDAGSVATTLPIEDQAKIDNILISHSHLDHIKDLAFLCDNCFGLRPSAFQVWSHETVIGIIKQHLFNDTVWPDFTVLPSAAKPTIHFNALTPEQTVTIGGYQVTPVKVKHPNDAMGYIVEKDTTAILFTLDTTSTDKIWEVARRFPNIKAIFTEVSFPNRMQHVANLSDHHTPQTLKTELPKMPAKVPVILTHLKPNFRDELSREIADLGDPRVRLMDGDGAEYEF